MRFPIAPRHAVRGRRFLLALDHLLELLDRLIENPPSPRVEPEGSVAREQLESARLRLRAAVIYDDRSALLRALLACRDEALPRCDFVASEGQGDTHDFVLLVETLRHEAAVLTDALVESRSPDSRHGRSAVA